MTLLKRYEKALDLLKKQHASQLEFRAYCNSVGSLLSYRFIDFDREGDLLMRISFLENKIKELQQ